LRTPAFNAPANVDTRPTSCHRSLRTDHNTLWTTTKIVAESSGHTMADSTSVNQLIEQNAS